MEVQTFTTEQYLSQIERAEAKASRIDRWEKIHRKGNYYDIDHDGWKLPGVDIPTRDTCGKWHTNGCLNTKNHPSKDGLSQAYVKSRPMTCFKALCSICWENWVSREASRGTYKIETYEKITTSKYRKNPVKHLVVSVPKRDWDLPYPELKRIGRTLLKKNNITAGCMVFHPYRQLTEKDGFIDSFQYWYYSPHFHVMGFGWVDANIVKDTYDDTKWLIINLGVRNKSVNGTLWYILSHCGIKKGFHSITWFGDLSNGSIAKYYPECKPEKDEDYNKCPYCKTELRLLIVTETLDRPPPLWASIKFEGPVEYNPLVMRYDSSNDSEYRPEKKTMRNLSLDLESMKLVETPVKGIPKGIELWVNTIDALDLVDDDVSNTSEMGKR